MKHFIAKLTAALGVLAIAAVFVLPAHANAQSYYWKVNTGSETKTFYSQGDLIQFLMQLLQQLERQLEALEDRDRDDDEDDDDTDGDSEVEVTTNSATDIKDDEARLRGEIDFNSSDEAYVWFEYGEDEDDLDHDTPHVLLEEDEDDEEFSVRLIDLDEDEKYYFRAAAEDEDGEEDHGRIRSFTTGDDDDDNDDDEQPDVETGDADDVTDDSAEIAGEVDMNDADDGLVFFVFGEDEDMIDDVESEYDSFDDVDEDGNDLIKEKVDSSLDGSSDYTLEIDGLDSDTEYFYALCVEYEDDDDDETLVCGSTEDFTTED